MSFQTVTALSRAVATGFTWPLSTIKGFVQIKMYCRNKMDTDFEDSVQQTSNTSLTIIIITNDYNNYKQHSLTIYIDYMLE